MQFNTFPALALLGYGHFFLGVAANSGYDSTCNSAGVGYPGGNDPHWTLSANCREPSGVYTVGTEINLGSCFGNSGGNLVAQLK